MILCSCNLISSNNIKQIMESRPSYARVPSVEEIMQEHGCSVVCATCAYNIKIEIRKHYESLSRTV
jgi:bacterioferritin-associated ferredoxin